MVKVSLSMDEFTPPAYPPLVCPFFGYISIFFKVKIYSSMRILFFKARPRGHNFLTSGQINIGNKLGKFQPPPPSRVGILILFFVVMVSPETLII